MKRTVILLGALCAVMSALLYCTTVDFENPIDKKAPKDIYLGGREPPQDNDPNISYCGHANLGQLSCEDYWRIYWFDVGRNGPFACDMRAPGASFKEGTDVTIENDLGGSTRLRILMGGATGSIWDDVLEWELGSTPTAMIVNNSSGEEVPYTPGDMPERGNYRIIYTISKGECPGGGRPRDSVLTKNLTIITAAGADRPKITLLPSANDVEIYVTTGSYTDQGVIVTDIGGMNEIALTRIRVFKGDTTGTPIQTINPGAGAPGVVTSNMLLQINIPNGEVATYRIVYQVTSQIDPTLSTTAVRVVKVVQAQQQVKPVIELNMYRYTFNGQTIMWPDTAIAYVFGRTAYIEKGVSRVHIPATGVPLSNNLVTLPNFNVPSSSPNAVTLTYRVPATEQYGESTVTRTLNTYDIDCENPGDPSITFVDHGGLGSITVSAGAKWNPADKSNWNSNTWRVTGSGDWPQGARRYMVGLGGYNPDNPVPGQYTLVYVAVGGCGYPDGTPRTRVNTRILTITP